MSTRLIDIDRNTTMLLPPDLRDWVPQEDMVHFVIKAVELERQLQSDIEHLLQEAERTDRREDAFAASQFADGNLATQTLQDDTNLLFSGELPYGWLCGSG